MLDRITRFNPLPSCGFCAMRDGRAYDDYEGRDSEYVSTRFVNNFRIGYFRQVE